MQRVTLPGTDLKVSNIAIGCWQFNGGDSDVTWEKQPVEVSKQIVNKALDVGINFFDTAEGYKNSEVTLGECLAGRRSEAVIASKFGFRNGPSTPAYSAVQIDEAITQCLQRLRTDYIDLYQAHFHSFVANIEEAVAELDRQVARGRIKHYGVSNFGPKNLKHILDAGGKPITNQMGYNLLWRACEYDVLPICREKDITLLAYSPLQQGLLSGKYLKSEDFPEGRRRTKLFSGNSTSLSRHGQEGVETEVFEALQRVQEICKKAEVPMSKAALAWVLQQPGHPIAIIGARTAEQVEDNSKVVTLSQDVMQQLTDATEPVKTKLGRTLDAWVHPDRCE